jgi:Concanavalin A-like lectin/glucanases superfamily
MRQTARPLVLAAALWAVAGPSRAAQEAGGVPTDGLVAYYPFSGSAEDAAGGGHHGRVEGASPTSDRFGTADAAYLFDGQDDQVVVDPPPALRREALSISLWAKFDTGYLGPTWWDEGAQWHHPMISMDDGVAIRLFVLMTTDDDRICWHRLFQYTSLWCKWSVEGGRWYHIAVVWDGGKRTHSLYVDGVLEHEGEGRFNMTRDVPLHIGSKGELGRQTVFFQGCLDDIRLYNRALSAEEVLALYAEGGWQGVD